MATIDKRKNKAAAMSAAGKGKGAQAANSSSGSRNSAAAARTIVDAEGEEDDEEDDEEEEVAPNSEDEAPVPQPAPRRRAAPVAAVPAGAARKVNLKSSLDFVQVLVFACVMLQALTLFVSYHMLQSVQHGEKVQAGMQASLAHLTAQNTILAQRVAQMETVQLDTLSFIKTHYEDKATLNTATTAADAADRK